MDLIAKSSSVNDSGTRGRVVNTALKSQRSSLLIDVSIFPSKDFSRGLPKKADKLARSEADGPNPRNNTSDLANPVQSPRVDNLLQP